MAREKVGHISVIIFFSIRENNYLIPMKCYLSIKIIYYEDQQPMGTSSLKNSFNS